MCKYCGKDHKSWSCFEKPRHIPAKKKFARKHGKIASQWVECRHDWIQKNPPSHGGYWKCYLCGKPLDIYSLTLDHIKSRSRNPELRLEHTNLAPCCIKCQNEKGSKSLKEFQIGLNSSGNGV